MNRKIHEQAYELAKQGLTNIEVFGKLNISAPQLLKLAVSDEPLLFSIIAGRVEYLRPFIKTLEDEATELVAPQQATRNTKALLTLIDRIDRENKALGIGYDLAVLASAPAPKQNQLDGATLTKLLREAV